MEKRAERATEAEQRSAEPLPVPLPVIVSEPEEAANARQNAQNESAQREEKDLVAQQGMNSATQRMAEYAHWQTILIFIGTIALIATLLLTLQMNRVARDTVNVTREMGRAQVRAYLAFNITGADVTPIDEDDGLFCKVTFNGNIFNSGQSPAYLVKVLYDIEASESFPVKGYSSDGSDLHEPLASAISIPSKGHINKSVSKKLNVAPDDILSEKIAVQLTYLIQYTDVFGEEVAGFIASGMLKKLPDSGEFAFVSSAVHRIEHKKKS